MNSSPAGDLPGADAEASVPQRRMRWYNKAGLIALKLAITAIIFWFIFQRLSVSDLVNRLVNFDFRYLVPIGLIFLGHVCFSGVRWQVLSRIYGQRFTTAELMAKSAVAYFLNQVLLGTVGGDAYRIVVMKRRGYTLYESTSVVFIERLMVLLVLLLFCLAVLPYMDDAIGRRLADYGAIAGFTAVALGLGFAVWLARQERIEGPGLLRIVSILQSICRFLLVGLRSVPSVAITAGIFATSIVIFWLVARGLGYPADTRTYFVAVPPAILVSMLPISIGGWGPREFTLGVTLASFGGSFEEGVTVAATVGLLMMLVSLPGAGVIIHEYFGKANEVR